MKSIVSALILAAAFLGIAWGLKAASGAGMVEPETARRTIQVVIGLGLAFYSNFTPKQISSPCLPANEAWKQSVLRVSGWAMVLAGLAYAGLWAFAPLDFANTASIAVVATALIVTLGYAIRAFAACRALSAG